MVENILAIYLMREVTKDHRQMRGVILHRIDDLWIVDGLYSKRTYTKEET